MGNDLSSSNNELMKKYSSTIMNDNWMNNLYGSKKAEQQSTLKQLFSVISENNVTESEKKALETKAEVLQDKVEKLEAKMAVLEEQLQENQEVIAQHADDIAGLVASVEGKSQALEDRQKTIVKNSIEEVFYQYERGLIGKDAISGEIKKRVQNSTYKDASSAEIEKILQKLDAKQTEVSSLVSSATKWIDQRNLLQSQYGATKSTYNLITTNIKQIGNLSTSYTNSDYDTAVPTYSLEKTDIVSSFFENTSMNVASTNTSYVAGSTIPTLDSVNEKYSQYFSNTATEGVDAYSSANEAVKNLGTAVSGGMLNDLAQAGLNAKEISDFLVNNFSGAKISYSEDGTLNIPWGHGSEARGTFDNIRQFYSDFSTGYLGALNTWDEDAGNTISSNAQIKALSENYEEIFDKMFAQDPTFSFKEGMYALFNPDTGLFKDSGVIYDLNRLNADGEPTYFIELAGDEETANMYKNLAGKIQELWGVEPSKTMNYETIDGDGTLNVDTTTPDIKAIDPLTFKDGDTEYAFIIDKNNDGSFSGSEEFVGGKEGTSWLDDLKSLDADGDSKLTGDELKNLKVLGSQYKDNAKTTQENGFIKESTTNINYTISNAADLGINEINLEGLENNVNQAKGINDINGSQLFNDSFNFELNGKEVTAQRKDDTEAFMNTVYSDAYGKNFEIGLSEDQAQSIINSGYNEFEQFSTTYSKTFSDINQLTNAGQTAKETRTMFNKTLDRIENDQNAQLTRASNKASSLSNANSWSTLQAKIQQIAASEGIVVDLEQAKGIYVNDGSLSAQQIVDKCKEQMANESQIARESATSKEAYNAIIQCARAGINASSDEITELLTSGKANTAQEVVEILKQQQEDKA